MDSIPHLISSTLFVLCCNAMNMKMKLFNTAVPLTGFFKYPPFVDIGIQDSNRKGKATLRYVFDG